MGRRTLYHSPAERREAAKAYRRRYYEKNAPYERRAAKERRKRSQKRRETERMRAAITDDMSASLPACTVVLGASLIVPDDVVFKDVLVAIRNDRGFPAKDLRKILEARARAIKRDVPQKGWASCRDVLERRLQRVHTLQRIAKACMPIATSRVDHDAWETFCEFSRHLDAEQTQDSFIFDMIEQCDGGMDDFEENWNGGYLTWQDGDCFPSRDRISDL